MSIPAPAALRRARRRDRRVYLGSHPVLFAVLAASRRGTVVRLGGRSIVNDPDVIRHVLTRVPLDRTAPGTTGGTVRDLAGGGGIFDESGTGHRASRRALAARLDSRGVAALSPAWQPVLDDLARRIASGACVDLVPVVEDLSGRTTAALLGLDLGPAGATVLARAARATASDAVLGELPGRRRPTGVDHVAEVLGTDALSRTLAVATVTTTYAAIPRSVAWVADTGLWDDAADPARREILVAELLRVTAPSPVLPRVPLQDSRIGGRAQRKGSKLLLVVRHAMQAHARGPSTADPAPAALSQLAFGVGPRSCPGAGLARAQLADVLATLAPHRPVVVSARVDRRAALPAWARLVVQSGAHR